jgi:AhpC/TSA antioxidant enzyme
VSTTGSAYPVLTDPDRALYIALKLGRSKSMGPKKPEYIKQSLFASVLSGIAQGLSSGRNALKGGDFWQVGGEFLFVRKGDSWDVEWAHRMRTTRDHAEVSELRQILGMDGSEKGAERDNRRWTSSVQELGKWRSAQRSQSKSMKGPKPAAETEGSTKEKEGTIDVPESTKLEGKDKAAEA